MKKWIILIFLIICIAALIVYFFILQHHESPYLSYTHQTAQKDKIIPHEKENENTIMENNEQAMETEEMILGVPVGKKVQLTLSQSVQETNYYCVPASLQMVLNYHGIDVSQGQLAREMNTSPVTGTEYADLAKIANSYLFGKSTVSDHEPGYHVQTLSVNDQGPETAETFEERVIQDINTKDPVFAAVNIHALYPDLPVANHMIVIVGYVMHHNSDRIAFYYAIDPYTKVQDAAYGGLKIFTSDEIINAMITNDEPAYIW